jgi:hypothetical protein
VKIYFSGVGEARAIGGPILEHPTCPRVGERVDLSDEDYGDESWTVRTVVHTPCSEDYDVYVVIGR